MCALELSEKEGGLEYIQQMYMSTVQLETYCRWCSLAKAYSSKYTQLSLTNCIAFQDDFNIALYLLDSILVAYILCPLEKS